MSDDQGGFVIPHIYFHPKRGWLAFLCRKIGKWLFLLGHDELHPYDALLEAIVKNKADKQ